MPWKTRRSRSSRDGGGFRAIEGDAVPPLSILDPGALLFITVVERVFDAPCVEQSPVHVPWHGDGDPTFLLEAFLESPYPDPLTRREVFEPCPIEHRAHSAPTSRAAERALLHCGDRSESCMSSISLP